MAHKFASQQCCLENFLYFGHFSCESSEMSELAAYKLFVRPSIYLFLVCTVNEHAKMIVEELTNSMVQEPKGSSPLSQQLSTGPYPEPVKSNLHPPSQSP
jgi:hypothetical protein